MIYSDHVSKTLEVKFVQENQAIFIKHTLTYIDCLDVSYFKKTEIIIAR